MLRFSRMLDLGAPMPAFSLPDTKGKIWTDRDFEGAAGVAVAFICNHCPFVIHIADALPKVADAYRERGVQFVAISSNDPAEHPEDSYENMAAFAKAHGFGFPYLYDETQDVALAFNAICTPDFFLFDRRRRLFYTGQFDSSRPKIDRPPLPGAPPMRTDLAVTGEDLRAAMDALLEGRAAIRDAKPSAGCSIKWKSGKEPSWA